LALRSLRRRAGKLLQLMPHPGYRRGLKLGVAAAVEHVGAMRSVPFSTLIDVGANIGQFSLMARTLHPAAIIHAFEPLRLMADTYERLFAGDARTTLHRCAAGTSAMTMDINVSNHPDSSSLLPISDQQSQLFPGTQKASVEQVRVVRIDDELPVDALSGPILVKLDVQGFELEALKGMPRLLARASWVYVEVSFMTLYEGQPLADEICAWLAENGFKISGVYNPTYSDEGVSIQADLLFARAA
jgi:FkbM family methyltransferase